MYRLSTALILATAAVVVGGASARGDFIPWTYSWSADPQVTDGNGAGIKLYTTSGAITNTGQIPGGIDLLAFSNDGSPSHVLNNALYHLSLHLMDVSSGATADLPFSGTMNGNIVAGTVLNTFNTPLSQTVTLGTNMYSATVGYYNPPGGSASGDWGSLGANVVVSTLGGSAIADVPEPAGLVLGCVGVLLLGGWCMHERRRRRATEPSLA